MGRHREIIMRRYTTCTEGKCENHKPPLHGVLVQVLSISAD